jgi:biopolymer transport protein ExbD
MAYAIGLRTLGARRATAEPTFEPNVIPFIDVLLVLLIIFMVTAPVPTVDIRVDLPQESPPIVIPERPTYVMIREEPSGLAIYVDQERVDPIRLGEAVLAHARANNPHVSIEGIFAEAQIFVRADQSTAYHNVVDVMSALQAARFAKVGIFAELAQDE